MSKCGSEGDFSIENKNPMKNQLFYTTHVIHAEYLFIYYPTR